MFMTMGCTSAILTWTHFQHRKQIMAYVAAEASYLLSISQITRTQIPPDATRTQVLNIYKKAMEEAGFHNIDVATPSGEVVASTNPGKVGKRINLRKRKVGAIPEQITISAEFKDFEPIAEQKTYVVQFPIVQKDKVIGYAQVKGEANELEDLLRHYYKERLYWFLATMMVAFFAVVYLAFRFTKPIDLLVNGAQQVAQGNLYVSLPAEGRDEMGRLAQTFNDMVAHLRERRELQERLNEAEKLSLLGRFAATVAHEVRNSLNFINLSIDQIGAKYGRGDERAARELQRNLGNIKDEVNRMNRLVNDFLAAGRQKLPDLAPCDLRSSVEQTLALVEKQAHPRKVGITTDLPANLPVLMADAGQIKTCFLNILTNAIQAMPQGGKIRIAARCSKNSHHGEVLEVRFSDTGPGIPSEDREKVFTPFYSTKATGFGLGLAITKKIVEDHGGHIYVANGQGRGTVIVVELPCPVQEPAPVGAVTSVA
jgi:signal transduction histidine kinase